LAYAVSHFQQLIPLMSDSAYKLRVISLASRMANENNENYTKILKNNFEVLTANALNEIKKYIANKDSAKYEYGTSIDKYLNMMTAVKGEALTNTYTNYYITNLPKGTFLSNAVTARISNKLPVNQSLLTKLLDSLDSRYEIMEAYYHQNQLDMVPLKYKSQSEFGKLCLYKEIGAEDDDDGSPEKITLLGSVTDKGFVYYAYKFKSQRDENTTFVGIAGPFKPGSTTLDFKRYNAYTNFEAMNKNWIKQVRVMIPELKKSYDIK